jgi:hypothetical protein
MAKNNLNVLLIVVCGILVVSNIQSCNAGLRSKRARDKEMVSRLEAEEKLAEFNQQKQALEEKIKAKEQELVVERETHQATKKALVQEQLVNNSLKEELSKLTGSSAAQSTSKTQDKSEKRKR